MTRNMCLLVTCWWVNQEALHPFEISKVIRNKYCLVNISENSLFLYNFNFSCSIFFWQAIGNTYVLKDSKPIQATEVTVERAERLIYKTATFRCSNPKPPPEPNRPSLWVVSYAIIIIVILILVHVLNAVPICDWVWNSTNCVSQRWTINTATSHFQRVVYCDRSTSDMFPRQHNNQLRVKSLVVLQIPRERGCQEQRCEPMTSTDHRSSNHRCNLRACNHPF